MRKNIQIKPIEMKNAWPCVTAVCLLLSFTTGCRKKADPVPEKAFLKIFLTDYPAPYKEVNVDIQSVEIAGSWGKKWIDARPGIYNLLDYTNGLDTLIASGQIPPGTLEQVRLVLGPNNSVLTGGCTYTMCVSEESGLVIPVKKEIESGVINTVVLDFDASLSVVKANGTFALQPVIRPVENFSGSVAGRLSPGANAVIKAISAGNEYTSQTDPLGNFLIQGLPAGNYTVAIYPIAPYAFPSATNVSVGNGSSTNLGVIQI